jgi:hypothetical protein
MGTALSEERDERTLVERARYGWTRFWRAHYGGSLLRELALIVALLQLYGYIRMLVRDREAAAFRNAELVLDIERFLGPFREAALQQHVLPHTDLVVAMNQYYSTVHFPITMLFVVWLYCACRDHYWSVRKVFVAVTLTALFIEVLFPLAPPRMMPGFVDTMARWGPNPYASEEIARVANQYAAMPSLHVGWAILVAFGVVKVLDHPLRWLIVIHPVVTTLCVVLTANHYWLDGVVAGVLVAMFAGVFAENHRRVAFHGVQAPA